MDIRTGKTYESREEAEHAGVPASDIAEIVRSDGSIPEVRFATGPFKGRVYKRLSSGQLVRVDDKRRGLIKKTDGNGNVIKVRG